MAKKLSESDKSFYRGVGFVLSIIAAHDEQTLFEEVVKEVGYKRLRAAAEGDEDLEFWGLFRYRFSRPSPGPLRGGAPRART